MKKARWITALFIAIFMVFNFAACSLFGDDDDDDSGSSSSSSKQSSDWLILSYFDADNNLNDDLFNDMLNEQLALYDIAQTSGAPSVRILALWDGENRTDCKADRNTRIHPSAALYELGGMSPNEGLLISNSSSFQVSSATKDLTDSVLWLSPEPDMGDVATLRSFLTWAAENYSASNIVLMLSNHGAGTVYETISGGLQTAFNSSRTLCSDDTNGSGLELSALDVKNAIKQSGLSIKVIWQDCCLQGTAENAYILRGSADYLVTSSNSAYSGNHYSVISSLKSSSSTPLSFSKAVVKAYADTNSSEAGEDFEDMMTQAVYNLSSEKQETLYTAINNLSNALLKDGSDVCKDVFDEYLEDGITFYTGDYFIYLGNKYGIDYYLSDIGYFCSGLIDDVTCGVSDETKAAAQTVVNALSDIIECAWLGKKTSSSLSFYYCKNLDGYSGLHDNDGVFGLTIVSASNSNNETYYPIYSEYSVVTGYAPNWGKLLKLWNS